jgi:hypothetical protein
LGTRQKKKERKKKKKLRNADGDKKHFLCPAGHVANVKQQVVQHVPICSWVAGWPAQVGIIFRQVHEIHGDNCGQDCYSQATYNPSVDLFTPLPPLFFLVTAKVQQRQKKDNNPNCPSTQI